MDSKKRYFSAFTLAEMMVVLLIMSIAMAAIAPVMTTKVKADRSINSSPWKWAANNTDTYFGARNSLHRAILGQSEATQNDTAKLVINTGDNSSYSHIKFKSGDNDLAKLAISNSSISFGFGNVSGNNNISFGRNALRKNTTGAGNVAVGPLAMGENTTGQSNIAIGYYALWESNSNNNIAIGESSLSRHTTGNNNIAIGKQALEESANGANNVALGNWTLMHTGGSGNIAIGQEALGALGQPVANNASANIQSSNVAVGFQAMDNVRYGEHNIAMGETALRNAYISRNNIAIGHNALHGNANTTHSGDSNFENNIALGNQALFSPTTGSSNIALGNQALFSNTTGSTNFAAGYQALYSNTTGENNLALGFGALYRNTTGSDNIAIGAGACQNVKGSNKVCIGSGSGPVNTSDFSKSTDANEIIYIGTANSTVYIPGNLIVGKNTLLGADSADKTSGNPYRVYLKAGNKAIDSSWVYLGTDDYKGSDDNFYKKNPVEVGPFKIDKGEVFDDADDHEPSDRRLKYVGTEFKSGLDKIRQLKVFNYTFKKDPKKTPHVGVIAQDLQKILPNAVTKGDDGYLMIRMEDMFYALVNAVKELDNKVTELIQTVKNDRQILNQVQNDNKRILNENKQLKQENAELKARLDKIEAKFK